MYWAFLIPTLFLVLLAFAAIGIKAIVKKNGKFEGNALIHSTPTQNVSAAAMTGTAPMSFRAKSRNPNGLTILFEWFRLPQI